MKFAQALAATLGFLLLGSTAHAAARLEVSNAWIPEAPPGVEMLAGYLTIRNTGDTAVDILAAQSDRFLTASVHQTIIENGVSRMRELNRLEVAPGQEIKFAPGGMHLMLMGPRGAISPGDRIEIVLLLSDGQRVPAMFDVQGADAGNGDAHEHHH